MDQVTVQWLKDVFILSSVGAGMIRYVWRSEVADKRS